MHNHSAAFSTPHRLRGSSRLLARRLIFVSLALLFVAAPVLAGPAPSLTAELALPSFLRPGDSFHPRLLLNNPLTHDVEVHVALTTSGLSSSEPPPARTVRVPGGSVQSLDWPAAVAPSDAPETASAHLSVHVQGPSIDFTTDANVPIAPGGDPQQEAVEQRGRLWQREWLIPYLEPSGVLAESTLRVSPSMLALSLNDYARWQNVAYDHTAQAANLLIISSGLAMGLHDAGAANAAEMPSLRADIVRAVGYLLLTQNVDGGWGTWSGDRSRPFETALAMQALSQAAEGGLTPLPQERFERAATALRQFLPGADDPDLRAYVIQVLSLARTDVSSAARLLWLARGWLSTPSVIYVGLALDRAGRLTDADKNTLLEELRGRARQTEGLAWWTAPELQGRLPEGNVYSTALAVQALLRWGSMDELAGKALDWLLRIEPGGDGDGEVTAGAAQRIMALSAAARSQQPTEGIVRVALEGVPLLEEPVDAASALKVLEVSLPDLQPGSNWVEIRLEGSGPLYFVSTLRSIYPKERLESARSSDGFVVRRTYVDPVRHTAAPSFAADQRIQVRLEVDSPATLYNVAVRDSVPAGCTVVAASLDAPDSTEHSNLAVSTRGDEVRFWLPTLEAGRHTFTYQLQSQFSGRFRALPALVYLLQRPSLWGRSSDAELVID